MLLAYESYPDNPKRENPLVLHLMHKCRGINGVRRRSAIESRPVLRKLNLWFTTQWRQLIIKFIGSPGPGINIFTHTNTGIKLFI